MPWTKVDDGMATHRKTRQTLRSHPEKDRDAGPLGLWVLASCWSQRNGMEGWIPAEELDRYDDEWESLAGRLVAAGYWHEVDRDGEPGYLFHDWADYNPTAEASASGVYGNHVRWHVNKALVDPECEHCPKEQVPESALNVSRNHRPRIAPESRQDIAPDSGKHRSTPTPTPTPTPNNSLVAKNSLLVKPKAQTADKSAESFENFWNTYPRRVSKGHARRAWVGAIKKSEPEAIVAAAAKYAATMKGTEQKFIPHPATWLNGERWADQAVTAAPPRSLPTEVEQPPTVATDEEIQAWYAARRAASR